MRPSLFSAEFRSDAVRAFLRGDRTRREIAESLGINPWTLRNWVRSDPMAQSKRKKKKEARGAVSKPHSPETLEQKVVRLEREIASLQMDREILKKAAAFFAKENG